MGILASRNHTAGDARRWTVRYHKWLDNTASIVSATVTSASPTLVVDDIVVLGKDVQFFTMDGMQNETVKVTIQITDSLDNVKTDSIMFTVVAP